MPSKAKDKKPSGKVQRGKPFAADDGRKKGRPPGVPNKWTAEMKDILVRAYNERGGFERFLKWIARSKKNEDHFYGSMMMKLLPFNMNVHSHKDVVYHTYSDVNAALADRGVDLEVLNKMKLIELKVERPPEDEQDHDNGNGV